MKSKHLTAHSQCGSQCLVWAIPFTMLVKSVYSNEESKLSPRERWGARLFVSIPVFMCRSSHCWVKAQIACEALIPLTASKLSTARPRRQVTRVDAKAQSSPGRRYCHYNLWVPVVRNAHVHALFREILLSYPPVHAWLQTVFRNTNIQFKIALNLQEVS